MTRKLITILSAAALCAPAAALATATGTMGSSAPAMGAKTAMHHHSKLPSFKKADRNHNGYVSIKEAEKAGVPAAVAKREDINHDGKLTRVDWAVIKMDMGTPHPKAHGNG
ncbi:MAG: EF-hand domain-containing protein [Gammaproteobacteria bacterium]